MSIQEGNEILAEFLGYTYKYNTSEDLSDIGGLYTNCRIYSKVPLKLKHGSIATEDWQKFRNEFIVIEESGWTSDYPTELEFHSNWSELMKVVEHFESLDLKEWMYKWESEGEIQYNFQSISVDIERTSCFIAINLDLDPWFKLNPNSSHSKWTSKIEAVWNSCVEAATWYLTRLEQETLKK
jgi:hypothetical protein